MDSTYWPINSVRPFSRGRAKVFEEEKIFSCFKDITLFSHEFPVDFPLFSFHCKKNNFKIYYCYFPVNNADAMNHLVRLLCPIYKQRQF